MTWARVPMTSAMCSASATASVASPKVVLAASRIERRRLHRAAADARIGCRRVRGELLPVVVSAVLGGTVAERRLRGARRGRSNIGRGVGGVRRRVRGGDAGGDGDEGADRRSRGDDPASVHASLARCGLVPAVRTHRRPSRSAMAWCEGRTDRAGSVRIPLGRGLGCAIRRSAGPIIDALC